MRTVQESTFFMPPCSAGATAGAAATLEMHTDTARGCQGEVATPQAAEAGASPAPEIPRDASLSYMQFTSEYTLHPSQPSQPARTVIK